MRSKANTWHCSVLVKGGNFRCWMQQCERRKGWRVAQTIFVFLFELSFRIWVLYLEADFAWLNALNGLKEYSTGAQISSWSEIIMSSLCCYWLPGTYALLALVLWHHLGASEQPYFLASRFLAGRARPCQRYPPQRWGRLARSHHLLRRFFGYDFYLLSADKNDILRWGLEIAFNN